MIKIKPICLPISKLKMLTNINRTKIWVILNRIYLSKINSISNREFKVKISPIRWDKLVSIFNKAHKTWSSTQTNFAWRVILIKLK